MRELNPFWLFVSSCLPGCGQMYQGYMKRGTSLLILFWVTVGVTSILNLGALGVLIAIVWLYAYFDSYNLHSLCKEGRPIPDSYLFGKDESGLLGMTMTKSHKILGWVLIVVGGYSMLTLLASRFAPDWLSSSLNDIVPKIILTALIIWLGIWFIRGPKQEKDSTATFEHYEPTAENKPDTDPEVTQKENDKHE